MGTKRRSSRLRKSKKRKFVASEKDGSSDEDDAESFEIPNRRKKRKISRSTAKSSRKNKSAKKKGKMQMRDRNREITALWVAGDYVDAIHLAEDYEMKKKDINELIEYFYRN